MTCNRLETWASEALQTVTRPAGDRHGQAAGVRAPHDRGARHPLHPAVVHRRARLPQVGRGRARPSSRAPSPRASASTARRSRASPGSTRPTCSPSPTRRRSRSCRGAARRPGTARMFCDILMPDGTPSLRRPALRAQARAAPRPPTWGSPSTPTPRSSSSCSSELPEPGEPPVPVDPAATSTTRRTASRHDFRRAGDHDAGAMGISVEFSHHEGAPGQHEIDLRYADALTTADNIMTFRLVMKEVALEQGVYALVHAQAVHRAPRLGHAHPPVAVRGRPQRLLRARAPSTSCPRSAGSSSPACSRTPPRSPRSPTSGSTPTSGSAGGGEAPAVRLLGAQQPLGAGPRADVQAAQGPVDADRGPLARLRVQPLPGLRGDARRRAARASRRATSCRPAPRTTSGR